MDTLTQLPWATVSGGGLFLLTVWTILRLVVRGDFLPRRHHTEVVSIHEETVRVERAANTQLRSALALLATEHGTTTDKVLSSLPLPDEEDHYA